MEKVSKDPDSADRDKRIEAIQKTIDDLTAEKDSAS